MNVTPSSFPWIKSFHYYTYSRTTHVITDHKIKVNIIQKDLAKMPARLQNIAH